MKRFHVHLSVPSLQDSIAFYSRLFGAEPAVRKDDYAKWMIDEPRVNFAISTRGSGRTGLNHLGLQADDENELAAIRERFEQADAAAIVAEVNAACCYARSNKHWVTDPQGIAWEAFHTLDSIPVYNGEATDPSEGCCTTAATAAATTAAKKVAAGCCAPRTTAVGEATAKCC